MARIAPGAAIALCVLLAACGSAVSSPAPASTPLPTGADPGSVATVVAGSATPTPPAATRSADPLASVTHEMADLEASRLVAKIAVGGAPDAPDWQVIGFGSIWVANAARASVQRIDPTTNTIAAEVNLGESPCDGLAEGAGSIWVPGCDTGSLYRIDSGTNRVSARIRTPVGDGDGEGLIGADAGAVWVFIDGSGTLARIDPRTNHIVARISLPPASFSAIVDAGSVWVTSFSADSVERVDEKSNKIVATIPVGAGPRFEAAGAGAIWVLNQSDGTVSRIDPTTNTVSATIDAKAGGSGGCIAVGEGGVWVTMPRSPVIRIDPATNHVTERYLGDGGDCISAGLGSVWLSNHQFGDVWRIRPA